MTQTPTQRLLAQVAEDERLAEAATRGPWEHEYSAAHEGWFDQPEFCHVNGWADNGDGDVLNLKIEDAQFIAASRTIVPTRAAQLRMMARNMKAAVDLLRSDHYDYEARCDIVSGAISDCLAAAARIGDIDE